MFIAKMQGGLANQMFQWALIKHLSLKYKQPGYLDLSYYDYQVGVPREFSLDKFPHIIYETRIEPGAAHKQLKSVTENFGYKEFVYDANFNYYFEGYWQCEKYFKESAPVIRKELAPVKELHGRFAKITGGAEIVISIHVRRGDYVTLNNLHQVLPLAYYGQAVGLTGPYDLMLVFSDDMAWCRQNLSFEKMIFVEGQDDAEDLWMMSLCRHNVIANSSFSWWGAWLNEYPSKKVVAPELWFGDVAAMDTKDIVPEGWIVI